MACYILELTPSGKYFFGNEKGFSYDDKGKNNYFIRSEDLPLQSTVFGALRYLLLPEKGYGKAAEYSNVIGSESFDITEENQDFGRIKSISPIFLLKDDEWFVSTPFDHNGEAEADVYTPFDKYEEMLTIKGDRIFTCQYNSKEGIVHSFMSLNDGHLENELFGSDIQVGINRKNQENGFFKKEYKYLKKGFSFAVIADIEDDSLDGKTESVLLGQGKTPFVAKFKLYNGDSLISKVEKTISEKRNNSKYNNLVYFLSDYYLADNSIDELYEDTLFGIVETRDYRSFKTIGQSVKKGSELLHLIKAGSILISDDNYRLLNENLNAKKAGFNFIVNVKG